MKDTVFHWLIPILLIAGLLGSCQASPNPAQSQLATSQPLTGHPVFSDDFSDTKSGWTQKRDANTIADYDNGEYRIHIIKHTQSALWGILNRSFDGSVAVEVDVRFVGGSQKNDMGVICKYQNPENYYYLSITAGGAFGISKVINGTESLIGMSDMPQIDNVILGDRANHLRAECGENNLVLSVNNVELERVEDSDLTKGSVGLIVGTYTDAEIDAAFDNLVISQP